MSDWIETKLLNWGQWMRIREDGGLGFGDSPISRLMGYSQSSDHTSQVPTDEVEASKTDDAIRHLSHRLKQVASLWYVKHLTVRDIALRLHCSTTTVQNAKESIKLAVGLHFEQLGRRSKQHLGDGLAKNHFA